MFLKPVTVLILLLSIFAKGQVSQAFQPVLRNDSSEFLSWQHIADSKGLKVMWWNIGCLYASKLKKLPDSQKHNEKPENLHQNLQELIQNSEVRPDVLILGEYCPRPFEEQFGTENLLQEVYPHVYKLERYNEHYRERAGIRIFSLTPINEVEKVMLDSGEFLSTPEMKTCSVGKRSVRWKQQAFWNRPVIAFTTSKNQKPYQVVATHLANPWSTINACYGKMHAGLQILNGEANPNFIQARQLAELFRGAERTVIVGDFNAPREFILGMNSNSYSHLQSHFGRSLIQSSEVTFVDQRGGFGSYSLDHAFGSQDLYVEFARVIPLAGSDHMPIYIVVD